MRSKISPISRRSVLHFGLSGAVLFPLVRPASALALGLPGPADLPSLLSRAAGIEEGSGPRRIFILFSITCPYSRSMFDATRPYLGVATLRWVPIGLSERIAGAEAALVRQGTTSALQHALMNGSAAEYEANAASRITIGMHRSFLRERLEPLLRRHTGRPLASPTFVFRRDDGVRIVRGALSGPLLSEMFSSATAS